MNIIAEIGINHNGDIDTCKKLINISKLAGFNYVKIQKRNPDKCVPEAQKSKIRNTPWGKITYLDYKKRIEFNEEQIKELVEYSNDNNIETLWASSREVFNIVQAQRFDTDIITLTPGLIKGMKDLGKDLDQYSLETVKMFYNDAQESGFSI